MHKKSPAKLWRYRNARYNLIGNRPQTNQPPSFPPTSYPPLPGSPPDQRHQFPSEATLITWSKISAPPAGFEEFKPYTVAIFELPDGQRFTSQLVDATANTLQTGATCVPTFRKIYSGQEDGVIHYGLKWRIISPSPKKTKALQKTSKK